jgi:hypothetical protein
MNVEKLRKEKLKAINPSEIMVDQNQLENVEYFKYLGSPDK